MSSSLLHRAGVCTLLVTMLAAGTWHAVTGHQDTAYFPPLEMRDIRIDLMRDVRRVHAVDLDRDLPITTTGGVRSFTLPNLEAYEVIIIE